MRSGNLCIYKNLLCNRDSKTNDNLLLSYTIRIYLHNIDCIDDRKKTKQNANNLNSYKCPLALVDINLTTLYTRFVRRETLRRAMLFLT